jgi:UDP-4-amino-4,6-dideoxy-L-N-acetyl-beta-L-altrosamine transaminase
MKKIIPYGRQYIDTEDIKCVSNALSKDFITSGDINIKFEKKISKFLDCSYALTCNSGTSAIFIALKSLELKKGSKIIMPSINFIASYNAARLLGAKVYLADVDKYTGQMQPEDVENCCKKYRIKNFQVLVTMYNGGFPKNAERFKYLKKKYKCYILEDACHALGASYRYKKKRYLIGSCKHSDICTFSLHPLKTITTGEGGIITTNKKRFFEKMKMLRSHGIKRNKKKHWLYDILFKSLNFRLTDFQAALGISQLSKINKFIKKRKQIFLRYNSHFKKLKEVSHPKLHNDYYSSYHLYIIYINQKNKRNEFIKYMLKNKIIVQYHYIPLYKFSVFIKKFIYNNTDLYYKNSVSLPIYYSLTKKEQNLIIKKVNDFFKYKV